MSNYVKMFMLFTLMLLFSVVSSAGAQDDQPIQLEILRTNDYLKIDILGTDAADIYGLSFEGETDNGLLLIALLEDYENLKASDFIITDERCFAYRRAGSDQGPLSDCTVTSKSNEDVFWVSDLFNVYSLEKFQGTCDFDIPCIINYEPVRTLLEDFTSSTWKNNRYWYSFGGQCTFGQEGEKALITSNTEGTCQFAMLNNVGADGVLLNNIQGFGAEFTVERSEIGGIDQGLGLYAMDSGWWFFCGIRNFNGELTVVMEAANPTPLISSDSQLLGISEEVGTGKFQIKFAGEEIQCLYNDEVLGSVIIATETPINPDRTLLSRTFNSNRPYVDAVTRIDNVYLYTNE